VAPENDIRGGRDREGRGQPGKHTQPRGPMQAHATTALTAAGLPLLLTATAPALPLTAASPLLLTTAAPLPLTAASSSSSPHHGQPYLFPPLCRVLLLSATSSSSPPHRSGASYSLHSGQLLLPPSPRWLLPFRHSGSISSSPSPRRLLSGPRNPSERLS
jgi:hypothetical protein